MSLVNVSPICNFYDWCLCKDVRPMRLVIPCNSQGNQNDGWFGKDHDQITSDLRSQQSFHLFPLIFKWGKNSVIL